MRARSIVAKRNQPGLLRTQVAAFAPNTNGRFIIINGVKSNVDDSDRKSFEPIMTAARHSIRIVSLLRAERGKVKASPRIKFASEMKSGLLSRPETVYLDPIRYFWHLA